jgi:hypothetical protein
MWAQEEGEIGFAICETKLSQFPGFFIFSSLCVVSVSSALLRQETTLTESHILSLSLSLSLSLYKVLED